MTIHSSFHNYPGSLLCRVLLSASASNPLLFDSARLSAAATAAAAAGDYAPCDITCSASARCIARLNVCEAKAALASLQVCQCEESRLRATLCHVVQRSMACVNASHFTRMDQVRHSFACQLPLCCYATSASCVCSFAVDSMIFNLFAMLQQPRPTRL